MSDSDETDVVEVKAANALLPNLTISVEKDEEDDKEGPVVEFQEEEEEISSQEKMSEDEPTEIKVEAKAFPHTKIYENKALKEMGLTAEELKKKKQDRAKRFQSPLVRDVEESVEEKTVKDLVEKVKEFNKTAEEDETIRLDAVHLRGLDDMSTDDIFKFFSDHYPSHIEWINDTSCNVVWKDETSAADVILSMTRQNKSTVSEAKDQDKKMQDETNEVDSDLDLMDSEEEMDTEDATPSSGKNKMAGNEHKNGDIPQEPDQKTFTNELKRCKKFFHKETRKVLLKLRFATNRDKKVLGGAKKSCFYQRYGNPNYGNMRGILSRSFMKRYHGRVAKQEYESYRPKDVGDEERTREIEEKHNRAKKTALKKRMYSDREGVASKKQKMNESSGSDTSSGSESESEDEQEREDNDLIRSSAKDLSDAIPADLNPVEEEPDTMMADRISKKIEAARRSLETAKQSGTLNVTVKSNNVWARLGNRPEKSQMSFTVNNDPKDKKEESVKDRLPSSLRSRLGTKRR